MSITSRKVSSKLKMSKLAKGQLKHRTKAYTRCEICGRSHGYIRRFKMCRICFRNRAMAGELPGVKKATW